MIHAGGCQLATTKNTITYHDAVCLSPKKICINIVFSFSWELNTSIFCSHANHLISIVNNELAKIIIWLKVNKLSLNSTETNFMIFHPRQKSMSLLLWKIL